MKSALINNLGVGVALLLILAGASAPAQGPVIESFGHNGLLVCTNLQPGTTATVEWAPTVFGPWTNTWAGLEAVMADSNGVFLVSVPMFYRVRVVPAPSPDLVFIPAGSFTMGDTFNEGTSFELPLHTVYVSAFYMDRYEITKAMWDEVWTWASTNGYTLGTMASGKATNHPVQMVTWHMALRWCNARSEREGRVPAYYTDAAHTNVYRSGQVDVQNDWVKWAAGYRLPTEAEWEKAARGGFAGMRFPWADTNVITHNLANYDSSSSYSYDTSPTRGFHPTFATGSMPFTSPVGSFAPNGYGLYDMTGNVWEWCWDWVGAYYYGTSAPSDPRGPASGVDRAIRGGSWNWRAAYCRAAYRGSNRPDIGNYRIGFRCVLPPGQP